MEKSVNVEFHQRRVIQAFKSQFFHRFGCTLDVTVRHPDAEISSSIDDDDFNTLLQVIDLLIPVHIAIRFPSIRVRTRKREIVNLRMIFMKIAREQGVKLLDIAEFLQMKCHSTIIHGSETANDLLTTDKQFVDLYQTVINNLNNIYDARTNESAEQIQDNPEPDGSASLHPSKLEAINADSEYYGRGWSVSEDGFFDTRQTTVTACTGVTL